MKLTKVTLTGADDYTDPKRLIEISREYPFVEWGILFSLKNSISGEIRFPSWEWHNNLLMALMENEDNKHGKPNLSIHLCGDVVKNTVNKQLEQLDLEDDEREGVYELREEKLHYFLETWVEYEEYITLEFDTENNSVRVLKLREK